MEATEIRCGLLNKNNVLNRKYYHNSISVWQTDWLALHKWGINSVISFHNFYDDVNLKR